MRKKSKILIAKLAPSSGSVPAPISSIKTKVWSSTFFIISMMPLMWDEKVLSDCSIDCSSPISAQISRKTAALLPSAAGINRPACAINCNKPTVFKVIVLPPVFGPVIKIVSNSSPKRISLATTFSGSIKGCLALINESEWSCVNLGSVAFIS